MCPTDAARGTKYMHGLMLPCSSCSVHGFSHGDALAMPLVEAVVPDKSQG